MSGFAAFVRAHLPVAPVPDVPEVRLHGAVSTSGLHRLGDDAGAPYWAYRWAGGLALARHVLDHPRIVAGRRVLDLGTGSGLVAIAAAMAGAGTVLAIDSDAWAAAMARVNAALNGVEIEVRHADPLDDSPPPVDVVLVGDLFYDAALAARVTAFLDRCLLAGATVLVGDPGRTPLPRDRLTRLADHDVTETGSRQRVAVFAFTAPATPPPLAR